jgi:glycosyltransferase involved in cell wall biosynthesis
MHILLIHQAFTALDEPGGTRHHEFARYLATSGHRITIIASPVSYLTGKSEQGSIPWGEAREDASGIIVMRAYTYSALHRSFVHRVISFLSFMISSFFIGFKVRDIDLVWGTSPPIFQSLTAWVLARLKRVPFLFEVRDLWPAFAIAVGVLQNPLLIRASEWLEGFLYRHADQVIVNSPGFTSHVQTRGAKYVELIPNGADVSMFGPHFNGKDFRQVHGFDDKYVALYAGAHGLSNDLGVVLDAAKLLQERDDIMLVLLGDGKEKPALLARAQELALVNLKFLPPVPKIDMPDALAAADACIAILKPIPFYSTVYPNKVFDYMAAGRPVVLAMEGVIREVIEEANAGIAIPPGDPKSLADAISTLAADPQEGTAMGRRGCAYVKAHFDRPIQAKKLGKLIENVVNIK